MTDVIIHEPERPVFVSDRARRRRMLRAAGLTCATVVALWVTAVVLGALGDPLPGLGAVVLRPSATPPSPAPVRARPAPVAPRPALAALPVPASQPHAAKAIPTSAPATTAPVSYTPRRSAPAHARRRHASARQHPATTRIRSNGGVRPGRQLAARQHPVRRAHRHVTV